MTIPRRHAGGRTPGRGARASDPPRPGPRRAGEPASPVRPAPPAAPAVAGDACRDPCRTPRPDDWMRPMDEDDRRARDAAWGFVE